MHEVLDLSRHGNKTFNAPHRSTAAEDPCYFCRREKKKKKKKLIKRNLLLLLLVNFVKD